MRLSLARWNSADSEPDPMPALRVNDQDLPIQFQQVIQGWIALSQLSLSHADNNGVVNKSGVLAEIERSLGDCSWLERLAESSRS